MNLKSVTKEEFEAKKSLGPFSSQFINFCTPSVQEFLFADRTYGQIELHSLLPKQMQFGRSEDEYKLQAL